MFDRKKSKKLPVKQELNDNAIRVITINKQRFVVGLEWETIKAQRNVMKAVKAIGKERNLDVVAIRDTDATQAGFAPKTNQKLRGCYSLIVSLASLLDGCCIAVIPLGLNAKNEEEFTLIGRTEKGSIHPVSDTIHNEQGVRQIVTDIKQELRGSKQSVQIPVYGDADRFSWVTDDLDINELLKPANIRKDFKLKPLRWGMTKPQLIGFTAALLMSCVAVLFISNYLEEQARIKRAATQALILAQEKLNKEARYKAALDTFKHPWITTSAVPVFLSGCQDGLKRMQLSIEGWTPAMIRCSQEGISASYIRPDNSAVTSEKFVAAVRKIYGAETDFNITQTSVSAFSIAHNLKPNGDDPIQNNIAQLLKMISLFQSVNIDVALTAVAVKDVKTNELGEELPTQPWQEYNFNINTNIPPELIFKNDEFTGVRINSIVYDIGQNDGAISYKISGSIYGTR